MQNITLNGRTVADIEVGGVYAWDHPDYADAYFSAAVFEDTLESLTDDELEQLAKEYPDVLNEMAFHHCIP